ncbi:plasma membrane localization protein [Coemansia asiatica]|uniref:Guanine nucleotide-binding protein subunit gamma n=1 Tax=Coemansia asiatica TaxID=1052880 RepID=A0A9W8CJH3_9FUNG|nr:plasma membrane localization protein [Coemansia asiatica]
MSSALDHKLRKIMEHNNRMKEQLELPRIPVSQASESLITYTQNTKDYLLPSIWGPPSQDPFASQSGGGCGCSVISLALGATGYISRNKNRCANSVRKALGCILYPCLACLRPQLSTSTHPPADFILFHPLFRHYVKHATLIERCFPPEKSGETLPNSNELSYLVYYAQSKPAKLTKVGAYLSKRIARDTHKLRRSDVLISLHIFGSLLDSCGRDLHFFAKDVLGSLDTALAAKDQELAKAATHAFVLFCRCHTGAALAIDRDLRHMYTRLVKTFALYARSNSGSSEAVPSMQMAALGLCALQAVAESQATYAAESYYELPRIVQTVVSRIANGSSISSDSSAATAPANAVAVEHMVASVAAVDSASALDTEQLASWAWRCLETLVQKSHGQHSRIIISEIFKHLDSQLQWLPTQLCVEIVTAVIERLQTQDQNMVIVETLAFLTDGTLSTHMYLETGRKRQNTMLSDMDDSQAHNINGKGKGDASESIRAANRRACIIRILESTFCRPYVLVGISVMEALNVLVTFLLEAVSGEQPVAPDYAVFVSALAAAANPSAAADNSLSQSSGALADYYHLLAAIGGLATHQYYSNQLADMVGYLVSKMSLSDESVSLERRQWLLQALYMVLRCTNGEATGNIQECLSGNQASAGLSLNTFAPLFTLLTHGIWELRAQTADCLIDILRYNCTSYRDPSWPSVWSPELVDAVHCKLKALLASAHDQQPLALRSATYSALASILREMLNVRGAEGIQDVIWAVEESAPAQENSSWVSLLAMIWSKVAKVQSNVAFERHISSASREAKDSDCWDGLVEETCLESTRRIMAISIDSEQLNERLAKSPFSNTADAGVQIRARDTARKLSVKTTLEFLGQDSLSQYASTKADKARDKKSGTDSASFVDRVLCGTSSAAGTANSDEDISSSPRTSALKQINGIRARVSVDWEAQMQRHDSLSMPQINLEQLRSALRDGLAMRSSDHIDSVTHRSPRARGAMGIMTIARGRARSDRKTSQVYSTSISMSSAAELADDHDNNLEESDDNSSGNSDGNQNQTSADDSSPRAVAKQALTAQPTYKLADVSAMGICNEDMADLAEDMVDANGQPISDEIRDLLESIDDGGMPFPARPNCPPGAAAAAAAAAIASATKSSSMYGHLDETSCSSAVSTPVINHVN